jgi:hypothetical protein
MLYTVQDLILHVINIYYEFKINVISNVKKVVRLKVISNEILNVGRIINQSF